MDSKPKIAWIEDDNLILEENLYFLSKVFDVDTFRPQSKYIDLSYARQKVITEKYDGIILDDMLLKKGVYPIDRKDAGEYLLEEIRSNPANRETPLLMYTTANNPALLRLYLQKGADCVVPKGPRLLFTDLRNHKNQGLPARPDYTNFEKMILSACPSD